MLSHGQDMNQNFVNDMQMYSCRLPHKYDNTFYPDCRTDLAFIFIILHHYIDEMTPVSFQKEGVICYLSLFSFLIQHHLHCKLCR